LQPLRYAASDAAAFGDFLKSPRGGGIAPDRIEILLDGEATRLAVQTKLAYLAERANEGDTVFLFVAGHSIVTPRGLSYFMPVDGAASSVVATGVNLREAQDLLDSGLAHVKTRIAFFDLETAGTSTAPPFQAHETKGLLLMFAARPGEPRVENDNLQHGAFAGALLEGLMGKAAQPGADGVDVKDLVDYVAARVPELTGGKQHPVVVGDFDPTLRLSFLNRPAR
jgi:uncharacterized caspase-like protein